jgi:uncharacterized protein YndB with AHSA1/START domain
MAEPTENQHRTSVRRRIAAPREIVYAAWIDPEGIHEWMCPGDATSAEATLDVRVGGSYRIVMKGKDRDHVHTGVYQVVDPPAKLVFTWTQPGDANLSMVTVEFFDHGESSELTITHERLPSAGVTERYQSGWGQIADKFAAFLTK